jgi:MraZ protein
MFVGTHRHSIDDKGRVILPVKFRSRLETGAYMAKGRDGCVSVYPADEWERVASKVREMSTEGEMQRRAARAFFAGAAEFAPDRQGRVQVPANLRDFANLSSDVVVVGVHSRVEIWDAGRWDENEPEADRMIAAAEEIPDFGI